jgi:hypothetical protein
MALGKKKTCVQKDLWVATTELSVSAAYPFYSKLNEIFA